MKRIFWGFCINWFIIDPLHYLSSCSDFSFEFKEILLSKNHSPTRQVEESLSDNILCQVKSILRFPLPIVQKSLFFLSPLLILTYLMLIFSVFVGDHGLINYIETKAKGCHKKITCKGTLRPVFIRVIDWRYISII